jgi:AAA domain
MTDQMESEWADAPGMEPPAAAALGVKRRKLTGNANGAASSHNRPVGRPAWNWREGLISAPALMAKAFPEIVYVMPGILPEGLTLLAGRPKIGKSWFVLDLCIGVAGGCSVMGAIQPGVQGDVLYLALEDNQRRLKRRLKKLLGRVAPPPGLTFHTEWRRTDDGGIDGMRAWCEEHPAAKLIVIDTLQKIRPLAGNDGYGKDYLAIEGLQKFAGERGISVLVLHHDRKAEAEDAFDTVSGTLGLTGSADAILMLKRDPSGIVVLHGRGRDIEEFERAMSFDKDTCIWRMMGEAAEHKQTKQRRAIIAAIGDATEPIGPKDIAAACRMKEANVKFLLGKMLADGAVEKADRGKYRLPQPPDEQRVQ